MRRSRIQNIVLLLALFLLSSLEAQAVVSGSNSAQINNQWIPVPAWLSGTWQARFQTFLDVYDYRLGKKSLEQPATLQLNRQRTIGAQQDATGQIWHYAATPYIRNTETDSYFERQTITQLSVLSSEINLLKLCTVGEVTRQSKSDRELVDSFYERTVVMYTPLSEGVIKVDLTITDFDRNGHALRHAESVCVERRVKPFTVINRDERGDLREKFLRFQAERNLLPPQVDSTNSSKSAEQNNVQFTRGTSNE